MNQLDEWSKKNNRNLSTKRQMHAKQRSAWNAIQPSISADGAVGPNPLAVTFSLQCGLALASTLTANQTCIAACVVLQGLLPTGAICSIIAQVGRIADDTLANCIWVHQASAEGDPQGSHCVMLFHRNTMWQCLSRRANNLNVGRQHMRM